MRGHRESSSDLPLVEQEQRTTDARRGHTSRGTASAEMTVVPTVEPQSAPERMIAVGRVELCVQSFGDRDDPAVLLVAGTSCSMDWWPSALCRSLAGRGLFVIRFDQRDTGRASFDEPGRPSYSLPDLALDAVAMLDMLGVEAAHWVGFSQGGWVSQLAALDHPDRVRSLVLISTRPTGHGPADPDLPEVSERLLAAWEASSLEPDWSDREQVVNYLVEGERSLAGEEFDETHARGIAESCVRRARQVRSAVTNHPIADQGPRWRHRLEQVAAPCLVLHGTADPLFPIGNAEALSAEIPDARMERLPDVGHELPPRIWERVTELVARHILTSVEQEEVP